METDVGARAVYEDAGVRFVEEWDENEIDEETKISLEDQPCESNARAARVAGNKNTCGLRHMAFTAAACGIILAFTGLSLYAWPDRRCRDLTSLAAARRVAWAGERAGALERRLQVVTVAQALEIVNNAAAVAASTAKLQQQLAAEAEPRVNPEKRKKRNRARCILQTLAVSESIVKVGTNMKSAVAVCAPGGIFEEIPGKFGKALRKLKTIICGVNIELVISGFVAIASTLAEASISCSIAVNSTKTSLNAAQQFDAGCAAATYQMSNALISAVAALSIAIPGCEIVAKGLERQIIGGLKALGETGVGDFASGGTVSPSRLATIVKALDSKSLDADAFVSQISSLSGRRLFLGGGKENMLAQCVVDVMQAMTQLSLMGIAIDTMANADCRNPSVGRVTTMALPKFLRNRIENSRRAACGGGIALVIAQLGLATVFLSFTSFHCTNQANIKAICGAGVAGITGAMSGLAAAGAGAYIACTEGQRAENTEKLSAVFITKFLAEDLHQTCPDISLTCFLDFVQFFSNCPPGSDTAGPVTPSCPVPPSEQNCPGVQTCTDEFNAIRGTLTTWFPTDPQEFAALVIGANSCFQYLTCFLDAPAPRRLTSNALRSLLLHKIAGPSPSRWRSLIQGSADSVIVDGVPADQGAELMDRLWNRSALEAASGINLSALVLEANERGNQLLEEAAQNLHQLEADGDVCHVNEKPLVDDAEMITP
mmetsp:Transcript_53905/g.125777  ORF Transcript_53905/g.125777 Transcript_53905/m.125777 type:complete len:714 (-) Transcript_53905:298-2439(-)